MGMKFARLTTASVLGLALIGVGVFASLPAIGQDDTKNPVITKYGDVDMRSILAELKLTYTESKDDEGLVVFDVVVGETELNIYQYVDSRTKTIDSLSFSVGYDLQNGMDGKKINAFNGANRFVKAYLDNENDPFIVNDVRVKEGVTRETLKESITSFVAIIPKFEAFIEADAEIVAKRR